jgi:hypothetical protein
VSGAPTTPGRRASRYPGFDVLSQARHWDQVTAGVVLARLGPLPPLRFFTPEEEAIGTALVDLLLDQQEEPRIPVLRMIDTRLVEQQTDGWRYADMPEDGQAWRDSLAGLDADARDRTGIGFAGCRRTEQAAIVDRVQALGQDKWRGMPADRVWSLWTRYACTAFYAHPWAWNEIGFPGPAYPRGYKNPGIDAREPFEVADSRPTADPVREAAR